MKTYQEFLNESFEGIDVKKVAAEIADLIDIEGWTASAAKASFKKRTGKEVKGRSKDDVSNALRGWK